MKLKIKKTLRIILVVLGMIFILFAVFVIKMGREESKKLEEQYKTGHYSVITAYDESNTRTYGYGGDGWSIDYEAFYGITLETDGSNVSCTPYSHKEDVTLNGITLNSLTAERWKERKIKDLPVSGVGKTIIFDVSDLYNGKFDAIYTVTAFFHDQDYDSDSSVTGYLHIKNSIPKCCRVTDLSQYSSDTKQTEYHKIVDALNPADYLDDSRLCYPTSYSGKTNLYKSSYSCVEDYQTLSDQLVDGTWSDAAKVYAFVHYMTDNYAYDVYQVEELNNKPRAVATKDADNPAYWLYTDHVGMCQDFTNALVIMCRHHNIPCTSLADRKHVAPVVYINNEWVAIDVNPLLPECIEQDMGSSRWVHGEQYRWDREYGFAAYGMDQIEMCIDYLP